MNKIKQLVCLIRGSSQKLLQEELRFIEHNQKVFQPVSVNSGAPIVLMELNSMCSAHIAYSYLANVLANSGGARIVACLNTEPGWRIRLSFSIRKFFRLGVFGVYRSFGTVGFFLSFPSRAQKKRALKLFKNVAGQLRTKRDLEELVVDNVWIGDLIYDSYLNKFSRPTIDLDSKEFRVFLIKSLELFVFWQDFFDKHKVVGVSVSHCVYHLAMPLRLAVQRNIPAFQVNITHAYRLNANNLFAYNDFIYFRERFAELPEATQEAGIKAAKERIQLRFQGHAGVDMHYSSKSAYGKPKKDQKLLRSSSKKKILIATHCFFDSPHSYGNNIFPDFYEWLDFLGKMTDQTDYDWYIKTHPDYLPGTKEIVDGFIERYPKLTLLPADASHHQIIAEGIDLALTTYGTIGFEYAALGIPVINASQNNPHISYDFNLHAKNVEDYRHMLLNLDDLELHIDKRQVYEYYFMRNLYNSENIFFENYREMIDRIGGYATQFTPLVYKEWLDEFSLSKHGNILKAINNFISSKDFRMDYRHFDQ